MRKLLLVLAISSMSTISLAEPVKTISAPLVIPGYHDRYHILVDFEFGFNAPDIVVTRYNSQDSENWSIKRGYYAADCPHGLIRTLRLDVKQGSVHTVKIPESIDKRLPRDRVEQVALKFACHKAKELNSSIK
jgi:hypothetical protein